ncbi:phage holin family protein [Sporofaciens sp. JLR.KK001]|jgi:toxin secretion/phage lysis holin|uniref:phage holin family protein n=1 Tax=Sporofaciens sp. JLR.KK001 TaxID=3112621 RepID=UPI002FEFF05F
MKVKFCSIVGVIGSSVMAFVDKGGAALETLVIFMIIDYITGISVAVFWRRSGKTKRGLLKSEAGWRGLCKKGMILGFVLIGNRLDILLDTNYVMNTICIGYAMNELISIMENAGLMGIPLPAVVQGIIEVLSDEDFQKKIK